MTKRQRILLIDDDQSFRTLLASMLRGEYIVALASDGCEGFEKAKAVPPDLAVIDLRMPVWDGLRTIKAFRADAALWRIPVIVLTCDASKQAVVAAISSGANDYILKAGFSKEALLERVQKLLGNRKPETSGSERVTAGEPSKNVADVVTTAVREPTGQQLQSLIDDWD